MNVPLLTISSYNILHISLFIDLYIYIIPRPPQSTLFPYTTLFRSSTNAEISSNTARDIVKAIRPDRAVTDGSVLVGGATAIEDRKSTRLNSSHLGISYAVFCLKKKQTLRKLRRWKYSEDMKCITVH